LHLKLESAKSKSDFVFYSAVTAYNAVQVEGNSWSAEIGYRCSADVFNFVVRHFHDSRRDGRFFEGPKEFFWNVI